MRQGPDDFFVDDRVDARGIDRRLLVRILRYVLPHRCILAGALAALLCGTACQLAGPYLIKIVIDRYVTTGHLSGMGRWVLLYLAALVGAMGFVYLQMYAVSVLGQRVILALRRDMFARMQRLPVVFFDRTPTGRLMTRLTSDVEALQELLSSGLVSTIGDAAVLVGTAAILLWMDLRLALVTFAVLPVLVLFVELLKKRIREANREMRRKLARMNAFLQEHVTGVAVVKAFGMEGKSERRFDVLNGEYAAESVRLTNLYSVYFPGVEMLASIAVALLLWRAGIGLLSGAVTFGTLVAFLEYARRFYDPIKDMSDKYNILQTALAASERIFRLLDEKISSEYEEAPPETALDARPLPSPQASGPAIAVPAIEFRDVWFSYPRPAGGGMAGEEEGPPVLRGVTFALEEGQTGAIVGATGAGKTTVLSLLCRFYEIRRGKILLFGRDIREIPREELRGSLALVLQDTFLFSGTVRENVAAGGEAVGAALSAIGVERFTREWGEGLATDVGERGVRLSTGQRQMVSFARALAREPRVLLLDEATSSVDPVTEGRIQEALAGILPGRTALVVAHRLSTVLSADRIIVMHKGKVREMGIHGELMAAGGIYRRLYALQFEEPPAR
ncbi:ABC transporter ATP-binding protein [Candidatus Deferrimicrobium sp.]|uniref:ABC transporter ATP-binding protein n=1 Tax=Candidatus Deferrimicrobium sp. TaxID=3060586 RepID=UPI002ED1370C